MHRAELEHVEAPSAQTGPRLPVEDGPRAGQLDRQGQHGHERPDEQQCGGAQHHVHGPLGDPGCAAVRVLAEAEKGHAVDLQRAESHAGQIGDVGHELHFHQHAGNGLVDLRKLRTAGSGQGDEHVVYVVLGHDLGELVDAAQSRQELRLELAAPVDEAHGFQAGPTVVLDGPGDALRVAPRAHDHCPAVVEPPAPQVL